MFQRTIQTDLLASYALKRTAQYYRLLAEPWTSVLILGSMAEHAPLPTPTRPGAKVSLRLHSASRKFQSSLSAHVVILATDYPTYMATDCRRRVFPVAGSRLLTACRETSHTIDVLFMSMVALSNII